MADRKPILVLDFDGVCHSYSSGWKGADKIPDPPVDGLFEFLSEAILEFEVNIFSSRSNQPGGIKAMRDWVLFWCYEWANTKSSMASLSDAGKLCFSVVDNLVFPTEKPPAMVGIDDRVITFNGKWPSVAELKAFEPWNRRPASAGGLVTDILAHVVTVTGDGHGYGLVTVGGKPISEHMMSLVAAELAAAEWMTFLSGIVMRTASACSRIAGKAADGKTAAENIIEAAYAEDPEFVPKVTKDAD